MIERHTVLIVEVLVDNVLLAKNTARIDAGEIPSRRAGAPAPVVGDIDEWIGFDLAEAINAEIADITHITYPGWNRAVNVADELANLIGDGIYDVTMIDDKYGQFGFTYERETDTLRYSRSELSGGVILGARSARKAAIEVARDTPDGAVGFIDSSAPDDMLLVDALDLSRAIYTLLTTKDAPSRKVKDRARGFRADVAAITKYVQRN